MTRNTIERNSSPQSSRRADRRWLRRLTVGTTLAGLAAGAWAFETAENPASLKGLLPETAPESLSAEAFSALGPTWQEWSTGAAEAITAFYTAEGDVAAQKAALAKLKVKLGTLNKALADGKYAVIHDPLRGVQGPLARRVALAEAVLATLEADPAAARSAAVAQSARGVEAALAALVDDLKGIPGGSAWLPFLKADELTTAWKAANNSEATIAAIGTTIAQLAKRDTLTDETQKAFLGRPKFVALQGALEAHLAAVSHQAQPVDLEQTRAALKELLAAVEEYEAYSNTSAAAAIHAAAEKLAGVAPDGGAAIQAVLATHFTNDNLKIVASETFLNRLLSDSRVEQGQVSDYILGAAVGGWQTTSTNVRVDVQPSASNIRFDLVLSGTVQSNTTGSTDQATVYTQGYHTFNSVKPITYDGTKFTTGPASTSVNANNTTTGATTRFSGMPLFGQMANRVAMREAAARRPQSEAIAQGRVSSRVTPKFNEEVDNAFAKATTQMDAELVQGLKAAGIYPDRQAFSSTGSEIVVVSRTMGAGKLAGPEGAAGLVSAGNGAAMAMHESVINHTIDQIGFNGKSMTEAELRAHLEQFLSKALSREFKFRSPEAAEQAMQTAATEAPATEAPAAEATEEDADTKGPAKLVFAAEDAVRIQLRGGKLILVIRAGLEPEGKEAIPAHEIVVPLTFSVAGDRLQIRRDALQIAPLDGEPKPLQLRVMNSRISGALPDRDVPATFKLKGPNREVSARVSALRIADGWITVTVE